MPASNRTDAFSPRIALGDNRRLHLGRPLAPLARARKHLEPLRALAHRIITRDYHSRTVLPPDQGAETRRYTSTAQGGHGTALTLWFDSAEVLYPHDNAPDAIVQAGKDLLADEQKFIDLAQSPIFVVRENDQGVETRMKA
jgi:hypothetical protein